MRLRIVAKHIELSESLKKFAQEKTGRLEKYFEGVTQAQMILSNDFVGRRGGNDQGGMPEPEDSDEIAEPAERQEHAPAPSGHCAAAELILNIPGERKPLVARARGENTRSAIDLALDKMERQLTKHKEKRREHRQRSQ